MAELSDKLYAVYNFIENTSNNFLLFHRIAEDIWEPINDIIELDEDTLPASRRKLYEEIGIGTQLLIERVPHWFKPVEFKDSESKNIIAYIFLYRYHNIGHIGINKEKHDEYKWFNSIETKNKINWHPGFKRALDKINRYSH